MKTTIKILTLSLITLLLNILNTQTTNAQCHIDDWTALKALYESTDGDNWYNRTGWEVFIANQNSPPPNCNLETLYGVNLNVQQRVVCLDLDGLDNCSYNFEEFGNNLVGNLPGEIGNLSFIKEIHLSSNLLQNAIPPEIGNLDFLTELTLAQNYLTGNIPIELGNLNFLKNLNLFNNYLDGNIPPEIGNLTLLRNLILGDNQLNGTLPSELGNLINLKGVILELLSV